jgi:hypothetical protein
MLDVNQHLQVTNSDPPSHNMHPIPKHGGPSHEWMKLQPAGSPPFDVAWTGEEIAIPVKCNFSPLDARLHGRRQAPNGC